MQYIAYKCLYEPVKVYKLKPSIDKFEYPNDFSTEGKNHYLKIQYYTLDKLMLETSISFSTPDLIVFTNGILRILTENNTLEEYSIYRYSSLRKMICFISGDDNKSKPSTCTIRTFMHHPTFDRNLLKEIFTFMK